jgi:CubicO group peptidase (beta-lactamase class C family)
VDRTMYGAVVERGALVWQDAGAAPAPWWSLSKTAIASAALVLVQRGRLQLDAMLLGQAFTLRQLLYHAAGLPRGPRYGGTRSPGIGETC